ncbi:MAG TPA: HEAT repeat domain-containing protein, partial [Planctomycetota bacterium]|nr:HEAT repeat domain-containing protein [Planctomycetota bacterium]
MISTAVALLLALPAAAQDEERIQKLIQVFSDGNKDERSRAVEDLAKIGRSALDALRRAATSSDLEVKGLAAQAIEKIEWVGLEKLRKYVKETLDEGASVEQSKIKGL